MVWRQVKEGLFFMKKGIEVRYAFGFWGVFFSGQAFGVFPSLRSKEYCLDPEEGITLKAHTEGLTVSANT